MAEQRYDPLTARERVTFQRKTVTARDSYGQDTYTWTDYQQCFMTLTLMRGAELTSMQQRWSDVRYKAQGRYFPGVTTDMRLKWDVDISTVRYFDILMAEDEYTDRQVMLCYLREVK